MKKCFLLLVALFACACGCTPPHGGYHSFSGYAQGGTYTVKYNADGVSLSEDSIHLAVDSILYVIDTTLSGYNPDSQVSRLARGEKLNPSPMLCGLYGRSREYWEQTDGALDVAAGALFDIWGFGFTRDSLPEAGLVSEVLGRCGMKNLPPTLEEAIAQNDTLRLNFNAIAQGFSCDEVASYLYGIGVKDMLVDIGEIFCDGVNPSGKGWSIGIDRPVDGNNILGADLQDSFSTDGGACGIVTSGNYRKFYVRDGRKYSHTIDPRTGYPVQHDLLSATVIAPTAEQADALATYCMVIGMDEAREFIEANGLKAYLISSDGVWSNF